MLIVLSPAKSLDYESPLATKKWSEPLMLDQAAELVKVMSSKTPAEIGRMMHISPQLSELNFERFQDWEMPFTPTNARPAILAFKGDVYQGMDAAGTFSERDFTHAQKTIRILSGLYGVLRPLDLMQPYRLEMGTKLATHAGRDLYDFWGDSITENLDADIQQSPGPKVLVNLASNEYFGSVRPNQLSVPVITPTFLDSKAGGPHKIVSFYAKRARGAMAGWLVQNRVSSRRAMNDFDRLGYTYDPDRSSPHSPVFTRTNE